MIRYLDTFFRHIWIWMVPLILFPLIFAYLAISSNTYTAKATLWVEQPLIIDQQATANPYDSPAKQTAGLLSELMNTREFVNSVIDSTSRRQTIKTQRDQQTAIDYITTKTKIEGDKTRLITLSFPDTKAGLAVETLEGIVNRFQDYNNERAKRQGESASKYYQQLLTSAKSDLDKANDDVKNFIEEHPNQISRDGANRATSPEDLEYGKLVQSLDDARKRYDSAKTNLDKVSNSYTAYQQGQATTIRVLDKPAILDVGASYLRQAAIGIGAGILAAILCAIMCTILFTLMDKALRFSFHAREILGRERILEMPNYNVTPGAAKQKAKGMNFSLNDFKRGEVKTPSRIKSILRIKVNPMISFRKMVSGRLKQPVREQS